jgi:hypothetical protein
VVIGRWRGQGETRWHTVCHSVYNVTENMFSVLVRHNLWHFDTHFYTTLYFVNQRNCRTLAMRTHALTRTRYFCSINVIILRPIACKEGLGYLRYVLSLCGLPIPPKCIFVTIEGVRRYFASAVQMAFDVEEPVNRIRVLFQNKTSSSK